MSSCDSYKERDSQRVERDGSGCRVSRPLRLQEDNR